MTDPKEKKVPIQTRKPGRLSSGGMFDRVKLPEQRHPIEEMLAGSIASTKEDSHGITSRVNDAIESSGSIERVSNTRLTGMTSIDGSTTRSGNTVFNVNSNKISSEEKTSNINRTTRTKQPVVNGTKVSPRTPSSVSPIRDFQKVPNSVTREAMAARLFRGKSKQVWDYLWSQSRGAITPSRTVRRSRPEIKSAAGFGSMGTVDSAIGHLQSVGLVAVRTIVGENGGNEYEVFTPEEAAAGVFGLPNFSGTTTQTGTTKTTQKVVLPVLPKSGSTGSTLTLEDATTSGESKTLIKTIEPKTDDDEAFAGLINLLKQAVREVTGKDSPPAEAGRWREVGELLAAELKSGAARTSVSSVPAFLAEHLRRRLNRPPATQPGAKVANPVPALPAPPTELPTDDELIEMFTGFLHKGMTVEDIDGQLSASIDPERWPEIRKAALERYEAEKTHVNRASDG